MLCVFDVVLFGYGVFIVGNLVCLLLYVFMGGCVVSVLDNVVLEMQCYYCVVNCFLIVLVLFFDVLMFMLGGMFKCCESIMGWLGDIFLQMYLIFFMFKCFEDEGCFFEDVLFVYWLVQDVLVKVYDVLDGVLVNFLNVGIVVLLCVLIFLFGMLYWKLLDVLVVQVVELM